MTVSIAPSEVRSRSSVETSSVKTRGIRLPLRTILIAGIGGAGLTAFSICAFSFFSDLADPRARMPRVAPIAAKMPDLKDGIPALSPESAPSEPPRAANLNLPRPSAPAPTAPEPIAPSPAPAMAAASEPAAPRSRTGPASKAAILPIQNVTTLAVARTAAVIAPPRVAATLAPARDETVRAKVGQPSSFVSLAPQADVQRVPQAVSEPAPERTEASAAQKRKPAPAKVAARKPAAKPVADASEASPGPAAPAAPSASDDNEILGMPIPGGRQIRAGFKGIKAMFGDAPDAE